MTYKTKCKADGSCVDRIDSQAKVIHNLQDKIEAMNSNRQSMENTHTAIFSRFIKGAIKAADRITQLEAEKRDLTAALNKASRPMYNPREDANWDSRPREETWEL